MERMRTVQLTFTFSDEQWEDFRKVCTLWGQEPTFSNVCCCIKLLALRGAKDVFYEIDTVNSLWKEAEEELKKMKGISGVKQ